MFKLPSTDNSILPDLTAQIIAAFSFLVRGFSVYLERDLGVRDSVEWQSSKTTGLNNVAQASVAQTVCRRNVRMPAEQATMSESKVGRRTDVTAHSRYCRSVDYSDLWRHF